MDVVGPPAAGARCLMIRRIGFAQRLVTSQVTQIDPPRTPLGDHAAWQHGIRLRRTTSWAG